MSPHFTALYIAGWTFGLMGMSLAILSLVEVIAPWVHEKCAPTVTILAFTLVAASFVIIYALAEEATIALSSSVPAERYLFVRNRLAGPYGWAYWLDLAGDTIPQLLWIKPIRIRPLPRLIIAAITLLPDVVEHLVISIPHTHGFLPWH